MPIRILLAEDQALVRIGVRSMLERHGELTIVAEATTGLEAIDGVGRHHPDVVLMDLSMPDLNGIEAIETIGRMPGAPPCIAVSLHASERWILRALHAGARGYVLKTDRPEHLHRAILTVYRGGTWFSERISALLERLALDPAYAALDPLARLSHRQREVFQLIAEGHTNREIATRLQITDSTVDSHRTELMRRLGVHEVASLVRLAYEEGLIALD